MNTPSKVCFIPDTNFFIQCRPASDLDWTEVGNYGEVDLILCRPVQGEIDNFKYKGNSRRARRAKRLNSQLRKVLSNENENILVRELNPKVCIVIDSFCKPDPSLDILDYNKVDDEIVGICHQLRKTIPEMDVRLLTHDTGPLFAARALNLPYTVIPDHWLLDPENTESEKEVKTLKDEITRIKGNEPKFRIVYMNSKGVETELLEYGYAEYNELSEDKISGLTEIIRSNFPITTFDISSMDSLYMPPANEEIDRYNREYVSWIEQCAHIFKCIHSPENDTGIVDICFRASNEGTRPAKDALLTIKAHGDFKVSPPQGKYDDYPDETRLPPPPIPRKWRATGIAQLTEMFKGNTDGNYLKGVRDLNSPIGGTPGRDPNEFYYKNTPDIPNQFFSIECEQWRHGVGNEDFYGRLYYS